MRQVACWKTELPINLFPLIKQFFILANQSGRTGMSIQEEAGVSNQTMSSWFIRRQVPRVDNFEACLNALGYKLEIVKIERQIAAE